jgi:uncharacterized membrane protein YuzA (DUF378 family)
MTTLEIVMLVLAIIAAFDKLMVALTKYFDFLTELWKDIEPFAEFAFYVVVTYLFLKIVFSV